MQADTQLHTILRLEAKDARGLAMLEKECFSSGWTEEQYDHLLRASAEALPDNDFLPVWLAFGLRRADGSLAGYISIGVDSGASCLEIFNIAVLHELRCQDIAWSLLRHVLDWGHELGFTRCLLDVRENNQPALALYKKAGFEMLGRRPKYYTDTGEDALVLVCNLPAASWRTKKR